ncbi:hypothetical protein MYX84_14860 [Acidobacteria bacterium AH-259-O06]|nr:hypothetical protein [Acidobacteria bacterium AH-259-O06]
MKREKIFTFNFKDSGNSCDVVVDKESTRLARQPVDEAPAPLTDWQWTQIVEVGRV